MLSDAQRCLYDAVESHHVTTLGAGSFLTVHHSLSLVCGIPAGAVTPSHSDKTPLAHAGADVQTARGSSAADVHRACSEEVFGTGPAAGPGPALWTSSKIRVLWGILVKVGHRIIFFCHLSPAIFDRMFSLDCFHYWGLTMPRFQRGFWCCPLPSCPLPPAPCSMLPAPCAWLIFLLGCAGTGKWRKGPRIFAVCRVAGNNSGPVSRQQGGQHDVSFGRACFCAAWVDELPGA